MTIKKIFIHHSALLTKDFPEQFDIINNGHKKFNNKSVTGNDIQYHYFIENGITRVGRNENEIGYHSGVWDVNTSSLAICIGGNYELEEISKDNELALGTLLNNLLKKYKVPIEFHRDVKPTLCPGKNITKNLIKKLIMNKEKLKQIYNELLLRDPDESSKGYLDHDEDFVREQIMGSVEREIIEGIIYSARKL